jgi:hypothetical protein
MTIRINKTYRGLNPELLYDEVRDLIARRGLRAAEARMQTYSVSSGATQSRVTVPIVADRDLHCGSLHVLGTADGDSRMTLELDEAAIPGETGQMLQDDIDFMLGAHEVKW